MAQKKTRIILHHLPIRSLTHNVKPLNPLIVQTPIAPLYLFWTLKPLPESSGSIISSPLRPPTSLSRLLLLLFFFWHSRVSSSRDGGSGWGGGREGGK